MKVFLSLCSLMIKAFYGITRRSSPKITKKGVFKGIGIGILVIYFVGSISLMIVLIVLNRYKAWAPAGMQGLIVLFVAVIITMITFVFSLITALSVYFLSDAELSLQALPIKPWQFFSSKVIVVYLSEVIISLIVIIPILVIFGVYESPGLMFYVYGILGAFSLPVIPVCAVFLILVPIIRVFKFLRRRNVLLMAAAVLGICVMVAFQFFYQTQMAKLDSLGTGTSVMSIQDSFLTNIGSAYPPASLFWKSLDGASSFAGLFYSILLAAFVFALFALIVFLLSRMYTKSLIGFNEHSLKKLSNADQFVQDNFKQNRMFRTLVKREFNLMNREPVYLFNGPFLIVLFPLIMVIMMIAQSGNSDSPLAFSSIGSFITLYGSKPAMIMVCAVLGAFLGTGTMISATAFSRDSKFLHQIKSLPINAGMFGYAKLCHALIFGAAALVVGTIAPAIILKLPLVNAVLSVFLGAAFIWLFNIMGLYLDTAKPRLKWDTPTAAFKRNPNALIVVFGVMGFAGLMIAAAIFLEIAVISYLIILLPVFGASVFLTWKYSGFAEKHLRKIEL